jgi:hypothetical protein
MGDIPVDADLVQIRNELRPAPENPVYGVQGVDYSKISIDDDYVEDDGLNDRRFPRFAKEPVARNDNEVLDHLDTHDCEQHEEFFDAAEELETHHQPSLPVDHGFSSVVSQDRSYTGRRGRSSRYDGGLYIEGPNMSIEWEESNSTDRNVDASSQPALDSSPQPIEEDDNDLAGTALAPTSAETVDAPIPPESSCSPRISEDVSSPDGATSFAPSLPATSQVMGPAVEMLLVADNADAAVEPSDSQLTQTVETPVTDTAAAPARPHVSSDSPTTDQPRIENQGSSPQLTEPPRIIAGARRRPKAVNHLCSRAILEIILSLVIWICCLSASVFWQPAQAPYSIPCINVSHPLFIDAPQAICYLSDFRDRVNMCCEPKIFNACVDRVANGTEKAYPPYVPESRIDPPRVKLDYVTYQRKLRDHEQAIQRWRDSHPPVSPGANDGWLPDLIFWGPIFGFRYWISFVGT